MQVGICYYAARLPLSFLNSLILHFSNIQAYAFLSERNVRIKASHPSAPTQFTPSTPLPLPLLCSAPLPPPPPFQNCNDLTQLSLCNPTHTHCSTQICCCWRLTSFVLSMSPFPWNPKHTASQIEVFSNVHIVEIGKRTSFVNVSFICVELQINSNIMCHWGSKKDVGDLLDFIIGQILLVYLFR